MHYSSVVLRKFKTDDFNIDYVDANTEDSFYGKIFSIHNIHVYATTYILSVVDKKEFPIHKVNMHDNRTVCI